MRLLAGSRVRSTLAAALRRVAESRAQILAGIAVTAIAAGFVLHAVGEGDAGHQVWRAAVALLAVELAFEVARTVVVDHHLGVDTIALVAMVGALALDEELAGAVIGLMFTGGASLEAIASRRARRELTLLVQRAPRVAQLRVGGGIEEVSVDRVRRGDTVLVRTGEVVPVDGVVVGSEAVVDTSTLSGEPLPVTLQRGMEVMSGSANAGAPFDVRAGRPAAESAYAALVRLVEQAQAQRAPFVRMADRYAGIFLPVTLVAAGLAWAVSGDPVRALAVVVVATPVPADPGRADRAGVRPLAGGAQRHHRQGRGDDRNAWRGPDRALRQDRHAHRRHADRDARSSPRRPGRRRDPAPRRLGRPPLRARARRGARSRRAGSGARAGVPVDVDEDPGQGIAGRVGGRTRGRGQPWLLRARLRRRRRAGARSTTGRGSGEAHVLVGVDGEPAGAIVMADELRAGRRRIVARGLAPEGVRHVAMVSGDRASVAERIGRALGLDRVYAEQSPEDKLEVVRVAARRPDAAARSSWSATASTTRRRSRWPTSGIAMGAAGATVSSETADAVITVDRIDRVADAVAHRPPRRCTSPARACSPAWGSASPRWASRRPGYLPPVGGALLQEVIDLAVILNALRALRE